MKIGIIGAGAVGAACAMATVMRGCASELVLVNRARERAKGMATDMGYGAPLSSTTRVTDGDYSDLAGAALVMITVGVNEKSGGATDRSDPAGRLRLLEECRGLSPGHSAGQRGRAGCGAACRNRPSRSACLADA